MPKSFTLKAQRILSLMGGKSGKTVMFLWGSSALMPLNVFVFALYVWIHDQITKKFKRKYVYHN